MTQELFVNIAWTNGKYAVSNLGNVRNNKTGRILKPTPYENGYLGVSLRVNKKAHKKRVHRLVAEAFLGKPGEGMQINHKDEIKTNNSAENLEWITPKQNNNYGTRNKRIADKLSKAVNQYTVDGEYVASYHSATEASEAVGSNCKGSNIIKACKGITSTCKGYKWSYSI